MKTTVAECIAEINQSKKSGLLSITVKGANALLKLFFREGEIYHLTCGNVKGTGCLAFVKKSEFSDYSFLPDVMLHIRSVDAPKLAEILRLFQGPGAAGNAQRRTND